MDKSQIDKLADFIMAEFPEAITEGGAGDVAIEIMISLRAQLAQAEGDAKRMRWTLAGNGYFMEEQGICGHWPCSEREQNEARVKIDEAIVEHEKWRRKRISARTQGCITRKELEAVEAVAKQSIKEAEWCAEELKKLRGIERIAELIGTIFFAGDFVAETVNERELETLLIEYGYRYKSWEEIEALEAGGRVKDEKRKKKNI